MSENGEIYTAGKNFTLPPALTALTNSNSASSLKIHIKKHTGEKLHEYNHCNYSCNNPANLITHIKKHTRENQYNCN